jgi:hypothetical protein
MPKYKPFLMDVAYWLKDQGYFYLGFILSISGFAVIAAFRRWQLFMPLGFLYAYSALMLGFTRWQGSRLFHPGKIAESIVIAFIIITILKGIKALVGGIKKSSLAE